MARWYGKVGFSTLSKEIAPGVWSDEGEIIERNYYGDILNRNHRWDSSDKVNDDLTVANRVSILADQFALSNVGAMKYIEFGGSLWKIHNIEVSHPRLILTLGGLYNENQA